MNLNAIMGNDAALALLIILQIALVAVFIVLCVKLYQLIRSLPKKEKTQKEVVLVEGEPAPKKERKQSDFWNRVVAFLSVGPTPVADSNEVWDKFFAFFHRPPKEESEDAVQEEAAVAVAEQPKERVIVVQYVQQPAQPVQEPAPAPAPVVVAEPAPVAQPEPVVVPVAAPVAAEPAEGFDDEEELEEESFEGGTVMYNRSFMAKYIQAPDESKNFYVHLKNKLMSYTKVRSNVSWKRESFSCGRKPLARLVFRGKMLCLLLPLDPAKFAESKYHVEDVSNVTLYSDTPCMYRIRSERRLNYAYELIAMVAENLGSLETNRQYEDYYLPYEGIVQLIDKGLVKRIIRYNNPDEYIRPDKN